MTATGLARPDVDAVEAILATLDPEQRAAATLPDGPAQIIAPAGQRQDDDPRRPARGPHVARRPAGADLRRHLQPRRGARPRRTRRAPARASVPRPRSRSGPCTPWRARSCSTPARARTWSPTGCHSCARRAPAARHADTDVALPEAAAARRLALRREDRAPPGPGGCEGRAGDVCRACWRREVRSTSTISSSERAT